MKSQLSGAMYLQSSERLVCVILWRFSIDESCLVNLECFCVCVRACGLACGIAHSCAIAVVVITN